MEPIYEKCQQVFGFSKLRDFQEEVMNKVLSDKDLLVIAMTGGGKSLCYQLPAVMKEGVTLVISPLRSLIEDQQNSLTDKNIPNAVMYGDISEKQRTIIYQGLEKNPPSYSIILTTPETIECNEGFKIALQDIYRRNQLNRIVIDEVHCLSLWGHDFRPNYLKLSKLKKYFPKVPYMALTASATNKVQEDIKYILKTDDIDTVFQSFYRPNLKIKVMEKSQHTDIVADINNFIHRCHPRDTGIIYCLSRKKCEELSRKLNNGGLYTNYYHAGLGNKERQQIQDDWKQGKVKIIIATIAFGMGIDKSDVRFVIHSDLPKSIESYYQEIGRGGRDGKLCDCLIYYSNQEKVILSKMIKNNTGDSKQDKEYERYQLQKLYEMVEFLEDKVECRHYRICNYFGETNMYKCNHCDNCSSQEQIKDTDMTQEAHNIINLIMSMDNEPSKNNIKRILTGDWNIYRGTKYYGIVSKTKYEPIDRLLIYLTINKYIKEELYRGQDGIWRERLKLYKKSKNLLENGKTKIIVPIVKKESIDDFFKRVKKEEMGEDDPIYLMDQFYQQEKKDMDAKNKKKPTIKKDKPVKKPKPIDKPIIVKENDKEKGLAKTCQEEVFQNMILELREAYSSSKNQADFNDKLKHFLQNI